MRTSAVIGIIIAVVYAGVVALYAWLERSQRNEIFAYLREKHPATYRWASIRDAGVVGLHYRGLLHPERLPRDPLLQEMAGAYAQIEMFCWVILISGSVITTMVILLLWQ